MGCFQDQGIKNISKKWEQLTLTSQKTFVTIQDVDYTGFLLWMLIMKWMESDIYCLFL